MIRRYLTTASATSLLEPLDDVVWQGVVSNKAGTRPLTIDDLVTYQTMLGFGAALTDASAYNISRMPADKRASLLQEVFGDMGLSLLRVPMTATDFATGNYAFDIKHDEQYIIPLLKDIMQVNPALKIVLSPWSAPAVLKENDDLIGGSLRPDTYAEYATIFTSHVKAYQKHGLTVHAVTLQNEPLHGAADYPCMTMSAVEQIQFAQCVGPRLAEMGVEIWAYDHNWDDTEYAQAVLRQAGQYVAGTAWHGYAGDVSTQSVVHDAYPDKAIHFTEITGSTNGTFGPDLGWHMRNIMLGAPNNWAASTMHWNLVLDEQSKPRNGGAETVRPVITMDSDSFALTRSPEYYAIAHVAKFVQRGAVRLKATSDGAVIASAYRNPDGSTVLIMLCDASVPQTTTIVFNDKAVEQTLQPGDVMTLVW